MSSSCLNASNLLNKSQIFIFFSLYKSASFGRFLGLSTTRGFFLGVLGTFKGEGLFLHTVSFFGVANKFSWPCGDVTNKSVILSASPLELPGNAQRISAAWIERTRSWFLAPSNFSQYILCSHKCLMKQTLLLYSLPEKTQTIPYLRSFLF